MSDRENKKIGDLGFAELDPEKKYDKKEEKKIQKASKKRIADEAREEHKRKVLEGKQPKAPKKNRSWILFIVSGVVALVVYIALMSMMDTINNNYAKSQVVVTRVAISAGTDITDENYSQYLGIKEVPTSVLPEGCYVYTGGSMDEFVKQNIVGNFLSDDLTKGEIVVSNNLTSNKFYNIGDGDGYVETYFAVGSIVNAVGGTLRRGDIVDMYLYGNAEFEDGVVMKNILIKEAASGDGIIIPKEDTASLASIFNVLLTREQAETLNEILVNGGNMRLVKINNIKY